MNMHSRCLFPFFKKKKENSNSAGSVCGCNRRRRWRVKENREGGRDKHLEIVREKGKKNRERERGEEIKDSDEETPSVR